MQKVNIYEIMRKEYDLEMATARMAADDMRKTCNPFKKYSCWRLKDRALNHAIGIGMVIRKIEKEVEREETQ